MPRATWLNTGLRRVSLSALYTVLSFEGVLPRPRGEQNNFFNRKQRLLLCNLFQRVLQAGQEGTSGSLNFMSPHFLHHHFSLVQSTSWEVTDTARLADCGWLQAHASGILLTRRFHFLTSTSFLRPQLVCWSVSTRVGGSTWRLPPPAALTSAPSARATEPLCDPLGSCPTSH